MEQEIIQKICHGLAVSNWEDVLRTKHICIGETVVALFAQQDPQGAWRLNVYVDLGSLFPERDPDLYRRMLVSNMARDPQQTGFLGIHSQLDRAAYHFRINHPIDAETMASTMLIEVQQALAQFSSITEHQFQQKETTC
jgi:hypothetical protein